MGEYQWYLSGSIRDSNGNKVRDSARFSSNGITYKELSAAYEKICKVLSITEDSSDKNIPTTSQNSQTILTKLGIAIDFLYPTRNNEKIWEAPLFLSCTRHPGRRFFLQVDDSHQCQILHLIENSSKESGLDTSKWCVLAKNREDIVNMIINSQSSIHSPIGYRIGLLFYTFTDMVLLENKMDPKMIGFLNTPL